MSRVGRRATKLKKRHWRAFLFVLYYKRATLRSGQSGLTPPGLHVVMLNIATRTQKSLLKACRGAHKRGARSGDNGNRDQLNFRSYTSTSTRSTLRSSSTHLFVIGSLAFGASAVFYALNCPTMRSKAETEEASATPAPKPTISQLTAGSAYIVGDCVMPGKLDNEPMLMPHAVRRQKNEL